MRIRTNIGTSLDGFVTTPEGLPSWDIMPGFGPGAYGHDELMAECDAVVVGRTSFDQGYEFWLEAWPWPGKRVYVLTSRPLPADVREDVVAPSGGPAGIVEQMRADGVKRDVQLLGGPAAIHAFLDAGELDLLGIILLPFVMGSGIPLFASEPVAFSPERWTAWLGSPTPTRPILPLIRQRALADGVMELIYGGKPA